MKDPHRNIFHSYSQGGKEDVEKEHILENNVTKAFVNTLELCGDEEIAKNIVSEILGEKKLVGKTYYDLQNLKNEDIKEKISKKNSRLVNKWVLIISPYGKKDFKPKPDIARDDIFEIFNNFIKVNENDKNIIDGIRSDLKKIYYRITIAVEESQKKKTIDDFCNYIYEKFNITLKQNSINPYIAASIAKYLYELTSGSIPDGWIMIGNNLILIENKIRGNVFEYQIERHIKENYKSKISQENIVHKSWITIFKIIDRVKKIPSNKLFDQFLEYLEECNLGPIKFDEKDFDSFYPRDDESKKKRKDIQGRLKELAEEINNESLSKRFDVRDGALSKEYIGIELVSEEFRDILQHSRLVHLSIGLDKDKVRVYITINDKSLIRILAGKLKNDKAFSIELKNSINSLPALKYDIKAKVRIQEKMFLARGESHYTDNFLYEVNDNNIPLEKVADSLKGINDKTKTNLSLRKLYPNYGGSGFTGVLLIEYQLHSLFSMQMDDNSIKQFVLDAITELKQTYELLSNLLNPKNEKYK